jgi:hypothetical protein
MLRELVDAPPSEPLEERELHTTLGLAMLALHPEEFIGDLKRLVDGSLVIDSFSLLDRVQKTLKRTRTAVLAGATAPILFASGTVFTEIPAAVLASLSILRLGSGWMAPVCGALMPWLHPRYALLAIGLAVLDLLASKSRLKAAGKWLLAGVASGAGFESSITCAHDRARCGC